MADEKLQHGGNGGFEHQDLGAGPVFTFLIVLAVVGLLVYFVAAGMYHFLNRYAQEHQPPLNPLKQNVEIDTRDTNRARVANTIERTFPEPRLETDERGEINDFRRQENEQLNSYGWLDKSAGIVHIPIERAMQLVAERGLPVRPQNDMSPKLAASVTPANHTTTSSKIAGKTPVKSP
jgi:hypothetical protein